MKRNQAEQDVIKSEVNALHALDKGLYCLAYNFNLHPILYIFQFLCYESVDVFFHNLCTWWLKSSYAIFICLKGNVITFLNSMWCIMYH
jgi:hypothetical protein